jgi:hypothetical protein
MPDRQGICFYLYPDQYAKITKSTSHIVSSRRKSEVIVCQHW